MNGKVLTYQDKAGQSVTGTITGYTKDKNGKTNGYAMTVDGKQATVTFAYLRDCPYQIGHQEENVTAIV